MTDRAYRQRENVPLGCGNCNGEFLLTYTEIQPGKPSIEFCPFCGSESVGDPDIMLEDEHDDED